MWRMGKKCPLEPLEALNSKHSNDQKSRAVRLEGMVRKSSAAVHLWSLLPLLGATQRWL
jgi:hypothetical protein